MARDFRTGFALTVVAIIGLGAVGSNVARQLRTAPLRDLKLRDNDARREQWVRDAVGLPSPGPGAMPTWRRRSLPEAEVTVLATPCGTHLKLAREALRNGSHVVSTSDRPSEVAQLLSLQTEAEAAGRSLVVGAAFAPGFSCLLTTHAATLLDHVEMISVANTGTGGPSCARERHRALKGAGSDWVEGHWESRRGGSGRELIWFPEPIGAKDCYRASLPSTLLLQRAFPDAGWITARVSATRRDRMTGRLPMLRPPHLDGGPGAVRVEIRGRRTGSVETIVYSCVDVPSVAAGTVAAAVALWLAGSGGSAVGLGTPVPGAMGLAELSSPLPMLQDLHARGLRAATYETGILS